MKRLRVVNRTKDRELKEMKKKKDELANVLRMASSDCRSSVVQVHATRPDIPGSRSTVERRSQLTII
jgi:hypothetical protein